MNKCLGQVGLLMTIIFGLSASMAIGAPSTEDAERIFSRAKSICERDNGKFWGVSLCGPILLVDWHDNRVIANQIDPRGALKQSGLYFEGQLPQDVIIANTPTSWSEARWTQLVVPVPT